MKNKESINKNEEVNQRLETENTSSLFIILIKLIW